MHRRSKEGFFFAKKNQKTFAVKAHAGNSTTGKQKKVFCFFSSEK